MREGEVEERLCLVGDLDTLLLQPQGQSVEISGGAVPFHAPAADGDPGDDFRGAAEFENQAGKENLRHEKDGRHSHGAVGVGEER